MLFSLVFLHLLINYYGVRGVVLRTLNRQRTSLVWASFRHSLFKQSEQTHTRVPTPSDIASCERLFDRPDLLWCTGGSRAVGRCIMGSSIGLVFKNAPSNLLPPSALLDLFKDEPFIIWFDPGMLSASPSSKLILKDNVLPCIHVFLKERHSPSDQLKAWLISCDVALIISQMRKENPASSDASDPVTIITQAQATVDRLFSIFSAQMLRAGWCADTSAQSQGSQDEGNDKGSYPCLAVALMTYPPRSVIIEVLPTDEKKKDR